MDTSNIKQNMLAAGKSLMIFAMIASTLVALTFFTTKNKIAENEREALLSSLHILVPSDEHDNDMFSDTIELDISELNYRNKPVTVYRARSNNKPVAAIFDVTAPDGYSGPIKLLIAIDDNDKILGVRVVSHKETPGLGDAIETEKSDWIRTFDGRSLSNLTGKQWRVKKDGGVFDQFTGATITPRAIVKTTFNTLKYYTRQKHKVFAESKDGKHEQ